MTENGHAAVYCCHLLMQHLRKESCLVFLTLACIVCVLQYLPNAFGDFDFSIGSNLCSYVCVCLCTDAVKWFVTYMYINVTTK